jgi:hypothetical protein
MIADGATNSVPDGGPYSFASTVAPQISETKVIRDDENDVGPVHKFIWLIGSANTL